MGKPQNVEESAAVYDTLQIRSDAKDVEGYTTFAALGAATEVPFFTVRNRSEVGEAYTNKDSKDSMPFAFKAYSFGIQFFAPNPIATIAATPTDEQIANDSIGWLFGRVAVMHAGLILRIREDDKLIHTAELAPAGSGVFGALGNTSGVGNVGSNGWPSMGNRWKFPISLGESGKGRNYSVGFCFVPNDLICTFLHFICCCRRSSRARPRRLCYMEERRATYGERFFWCCTCAR